MMTQVLHCPYCDETAIVRYGKSPEGKQRYRCRQCLEGRGRPLLLEYAYAGQSPAIKQHMVDLAMKASGMRDTARVLQVSPTTVIKELKKAPEIAYVNQAVLQPLHPEHVEVESCRADELAQRRGLASELDAMWAYGARKINPRWLWHAMDHDSGKVLASVFGRRQDTVFLERQGLWALFGITRFYTDGWGTYERHLTPEQPVVGKQHTQNIERQHIKLRIRMKRLVRRTIGFAKTTTMHDLVVGLFINRYEFGRPI